ncbi:siderophore biosynthesis protein [Streptomyces sp. NPDC000594]|uniref:ATP-grasp domain-containing protein n=1 Tax=Streptomyces sp. NPDC000594 TaxID=3154261 RepID=UPI00332C03CA
MQMYVLAHNPTDSVTEGFLPAADRLGLDVTLLTDQPGAHRDRYRERHPGVEILDCDVRDFHAVISRISGHRRPDAVFSNSDHLQTQTALAAEWFGLPGKSWRAALAAKDKAQTRRLLTADAVRSLELAARQDPADLLDSTLPFPWVLKPREGVASEDVIWVEGPDDYLRHAAAIRARRPGAALVAEEYLPGELHTLETLGDGSRLHVLGGFHTELSPLPYFIEERMAFVPALPEPVVTQVLEALTALGAGFGACHTEFVVHAGRARIIEVNYRAIGDQCDLLLAELLGIPLFEHILRTHLGEPLPDSLGLRHDRAARLAYPLAERAGTLTAAPGPADLTIDGVRLTYRPAREIGERHELYGTNRDFLGIVRAIGPGRERVDRVVDEFTAGLSWEITP